MLFRSQLERIKITISNLIALLVQLATFATTYLELLLQLFVLLEVTVLQVHKITMAFCVHLVTGNLKQEEHHVSHAQLDLIVTLLD